MSESKTLPAAADAPRSRYVVVLTASRRVPHGANVLTVSAGCALREYMLSPNKTMQQLPRPLAADERLVADPDRTIKLGDIVADDATV